MDDRFDDVIEKPTVAQTSAAAAMTRIGLDVGTSKIVRARGDAGHSDINEQLNAFFTVPYSALTQTTLKQNSVPHYRDGDQLVVCGGAAEKFAHMFNAETRRPMAKGVLNPNEPSAVGVLEAIMGMLIPQAKQPGEVMAFSVPAAGADINAEVTYHEGILKNYLRGKGYTPLAVNEGLAVVLAELAEESFTGIGISCGGGMCNVALSYLSIPSITFSLAQGGDYIDAAVGSVVNEPATRVKAIKEEGLDLSKSAADKVTKALQIYYNKLIETLVDELISALRRSQKNPRAQFELPLVLAGGTSMPRGFRDRFDKVLRSRTLPFAIGEVRMASNPLTTTARGTLVAALAEK
ncbi:MAG TPA: hypothetical protein VET48_07805 [Steroidobacteraceae bacterium]|nr:hypothetical protein [Steroidobacteraceae bacterium]